ncbi:heparan-alpha-glucosaminide N-acetyltransferase domain-containing protein [Actinomycetospora soli]|uniref:heparan-alpha-glucosaminide N-acetyltransferase domain-containing protein n=1 Tax=Actinomycetospora soli TaxID=2893887 RepID=UPI001E491D55|nr:heparan-alpha-glucosaminide N-acetyltransferase domain-containing protein [Actinomycetospora soli]MCD2190413.1 heparan-alpha-glucosaminide N-acetyltransferase domain-containing protein [Actinomycetospora soli]
MTHALTLTPPEPAPPVAEEPAPPRARILGVDTARGLALIGMMAVHALYESDAAGNATWTSVLAGGKSAALFALLAGVGIAFTTGRSRVPVRSDRALPTAVGLVVRGLAVGLVGLLLGGNDPEVAAVILVYYALLFVAAVPLVFLGRRTLLALGAVLVVAAPVASHALRAHLPVASGLNPSFAWLASDPGGLLTELAVTGYYPVLSWLPYLCVGLAVGRMRLSSARTAGLLAGVGAALAVTAVVVSDLLIREGLPRILAASSGADPATVHEALTVGPDGVTPTTTWWWLAVDTPHSSTPPDLTLTIGISLAVLGVALLADHVTRPRLRVALDVVRAPLAAAGGMTLTFYALHVLFINSDLDVYGPTAGYVIQVVAVLLLGWGWRATAGRGPLEAVVTALSRRAVRAVTAARAART